MQRTPVCLPLFGSVRARRMQGCLFFFSPFFPGTAYVEGGGQENEQGVGEGEKRHQRSEKQTSAIVLRAGPLDVILVNVGLVRTEGGKTCCRSFGLKRKRL